jgi:hypothetical protein
VTDCCSTSIRFLKDQRLCLVLSVPFTAAYLHTVFTFVVILTLIMLRSAGLSTTCYGLVGVICLPPHCFLHFLMCRSTCSHMCVCWKTTSHLNLNDVEYPVGFISSGMGHLRIMHVRYGITSVNFFPTFGLPSSPAFVWPPHAVLI